MSATLSAIPRPCRHHRFGLALRPRLGVAPRAAHAAARAPLLSGTRSTVHAGPGAKDCEEYRRSNDTQGETL